MDLYRLILLFIIFLFPSRDFAQNNVEDFKWSHQINKSGSINIIGAINDKNYVCFVNEEKDLVIGIYDKNCMEIASKKLDIKVDNVNFIYHKSIVRSNKIVLFIENKDKKIKKTTLFAVVLNENLEIANQRINLEEIDLSLYTPIQIKQNIVFMFEIMFSPDFSKFSIRKYYYAKDYENVINTIKVFDFNNLTGAEYSYDFVYNVLITRLADVLVDNTGNLYLMKSMKVKKKDSDVEDKREVHFFEKIDKSLNKNTLSFGLEGNVISSLRTFILDDEIVFTGFKNNLNEETISKYFYLKSYDINSLSLKKEIESELKAIYPDKLRNKDEMIYVPLNVYKKSDNSYMIVSEQNKYIRTQYTTYPILGDIAIITTDFSKKDAVNLITKIPRYLENVYNSISNTESIFVNNSLYLFYENNLKNIAVINEVDYENVANPFSEKNGIYQYVFKEDNTISKKIVYPYNISKERILLKSIRKDGNGGFIFTGNNKIGLFKS